MIRSLAPVLVRQPRYVEDKIFERLVEPDRVISFGVNWVDDAGEIHINRGYRVQMSSSIGPYKGGLRFHPDGRPGPAQVPGLRADLEELADHPAHGRGQGRLGLRPEGAQRVGDPPVLPVVHDRAASPTSASSPTSRPATSAWASARSAISSASTSGSPSGSPGRSPARAINWGGSHIRQEATGYGVVYFARRDAGHPGRRPGGEDVPRVGQRERRPVHGREADRPRRPDGDPVRLRRLHPRS